MKNKLLIAILSICSAAICATCMVGCNPTAPSTPPEDPSGPPVELPTPPSSDADQTPPSVPAPGDKHEHTFSADWTYDKNSHWHASDCGHNETKDYSLHDLDLNGCKVCSFKYTQGLEYEAIQSNKVTSGYRVKGIGTATEAEINIPPEYNGLPVKQILWNAFKDCTQMKAITVPECCNFFGELVFENCTNLTRVELPDSLTQLYYGVFKNCSSLTSLKLPENLEYIYENVFEGSGIKSLYIPAGTKQLENTALYGSYITLANVTIDPANPYIKKDGNCIIYIKNSLNQVLAGDKTSVIPSYAKNISSSAFSECLELKIIEIPDGVENIYDNAFYGCTGLETVTLHKTLKAIHRGAFEKCASLKNIFFDGTVTEWQALVFDKNGDRWDIDSGNYIVHCSDGEVNK